MEYLPYPHPQDKEQSRVIGLEEGLDRWAQRFIARAQ